MKAKQLIQELQKLSGDTEILFFSDEEGNTVYEQVTIETEGAGTVVFVPNTLSEEYTSN